MSKTDKWQLLRMHSFLTADTRVRNVIDTCPTHEMEREVKNREYQQRLEAKQKGKAEKSGTMQETKKKDLRQVEDVIKEPRGGILEKKEIPISDKKKRPELDSGTALQLFLDHIPIRSIPGIKNSPGTIP